MKNLVILIGRIGETPATRQIGDAKSITSFSLVTTSPKIADGKRVINAETGYRETHDEWHRVTAFNGLGKTVAEHKKKGELVEVQGRLHYSKWADNAGSERYSVEIVADEILFL